MRNLNKGMLLLAADGAGGGSADDGARQPGNAEDTLSRAFTGADAGAHGAKPEAKPEGEKAAGGAETGSEIKLAAWAEQLPPEMRTNAQTAAKLARFAKVPDLAKAWLELEGKSGNAVFPGKDATAEEVAAFWEQAGRPKAAAEYAFAADKERDGSTFAEAAFKANLTSDQAEAMFRNLTEAGARRVEAMAQTASRQVRETAAALEAEYGSKYEEKMELLTRGLAAAGPNIGRLLGQAGLAGNPEIIKAFIAFGQMTSESGAARGGKAGEPMQSVFEGGSFDFKT